MISLYKILTDEDNPLNKLFDLNTNTVTRGHNKKLKKVFVRSRSRQHFFINRVINDWNSLPYNVVNALSVDSFKIGLDRFWINRMFEI